MLLTLPEFNNKRDQALKLFGRIWYNHMISKKWLSEPVEKESNAKLLWLFVWALDGYGYSAEDNYITEKQLVTIFKRVNSIP